MTASLTPPSPRRRGPKTRTGPNPSHDGPRRKVSAEAIREQLSRMLASALFSGAERMSRFLEHVVEAHLAGKPEELKQYAVGLAVFDRDADFDTRTDPIVRVEAGRLRDKIREYYDTVGKDDPIWLGLRERGYRPLVRERQSQSATEAPLPAHVKTVETSAAQAPTVTVLPFVDLSPDGSQRYFCRALTDQITNVIAKARLLKTVGRTSAEKLAESNHMIPSIGEKTNADAVLEGSAQQAGDRLRVRVQLISVATGVDLWADQYDCEVHDIFAIQDHITQQVLEGLRKTLLPPCLRPTSGAPTPSPGAKDRLEGEESASADEHMQHSTKKPASDCT